MIRPKPKPLSATDLNISEPYRTNRLLGHSQTWMNHYKSALDAAMALLDTLIQQRCVLEDDVKEYEQLKSELGDE